MSVPGDFSFIPDACNRDAYTDMYAAITKAEAWDWVKEDPGEGGFMFSTSPTLAKICAHMDDRVGHSGASFAMCMRQMQHLARIGWDAWVATQA